MQAEAKEPLGKPADAKPEQFRLSECERRAIELVAQGNTQAEAAELIGRSKRSIEAHLSRVSRRVGARNTAHLVGIVVAAGIVSNLAPKPIEA